MKRSPELETDHRTDQGAVFLDIHT